MDLEVNEQSNMQSNRTAKRYELNCTTNCPNCFQMMSEIIQLRMELGKMEDTNKGVRKKFTIAPTLYTFYRDGLSKRHLARSASMSSSDILDSFQEEGDNSYLENIVQQCYLPLPNPFFTSLDFISQFLFVCDEMCHILSSEPRLLRLKSPAYVFGDLHGNMPDLLAFAKTMWPLGIHLTPGTFLFLGDYVDRGQYGIEILAYIFAQKIMLRDKVFLLRGNHEIRAVNGCDRFYGNRCFLGQLKERYPEDVALSIWEHTNKVFDHLPLAATIDDVIFCVHGGIPRPIDGSDAMSIDIINHIPTPFDAWNTRSNELADLCQVVIDLLWSDPAQNRQEAYLDKHGFGKGDRGPGAVCYGQKAVEEFIQFNGLSHILRAHEPTASGVSVRKGAKVITIFSTSRDHNYENALCGCILVDGENIIAINHPDGTLGDGGK